jgi:hypothetical protein
MTWVTLLINLENELKVALGTKESTTEEIPFEASDPGTPASVPKTKSVPKPTLAPPVSPIVEDKKTNHKNAIIKKRVELTEQCVEGRTLLTEENLKKWIAEGLTYWKIAEMTGVWDAEVSALAKSFGLQSEVSKTIAFKKKK